MKHKHGILDVCLCLIVILAVAGSIQTTLAGMPGQGIHEAEFELDDGRTLRYSLAVPEIAEGTLAPLVLALHYGGEVTPYISMGFLKQFAAPGFASLSPVIVAPDCPGRGWEDPDSERAVLALLDHVLEHWPVDSGRVVITGFSMGGGGTWYMVARHPDRFSVAVPVAGWPAAEPDGSVPVYAIHGELDDRVKVGPTEKAIAALQKKGAQATLVIAKDLPHYQTSRYAVPLMDAANWIEAYWARKGSSLGKGREVGE
jgi:predicted peptidase